MCLLKDLKACQAAGCPPAPNPATDWPITTADALQLIDNVIHPFKIHNAASMLYYTSEMPLK